MIEKLRIQRTEGRKISVLCLPFSVLCLLSSVLCLLFFIFSGCRNKQVYTDTQVIMGTFVEVKSPDERAARIVFDEIKKIDELLSKYKEESEITVLNRTGFLIPSPRTLFVIKKAKEFWLLSDGMFDVTIGPLMDLWGFTDKNYRLPSEEEIKNTLERVGFDKVIIEEGGSNLIRFKVPGMKMDLGGIAKGYAVDCAVNRLRQVGVEDALINAGGQIYCLKTVSRKPCRIAIKNPRAGNIWDIIELHNSGAATSGDYEQYFMLEGKRYSHIISPKTGKPVDSKIISVTVVTENSLTADALSTVVFLLGKEKGGILAEKFPGVKLNIIEKKDVQDNT